MIAILPICMRRTAARPESTRAISADGDYLGLQMTTRTLIKRTPVYAAWTALLWERAAPVLAGPLAMAAVYLTLALFGVFERLGDPVRALALLAAIIAGAVWARFAILHFSPPRLEDAERRVEADSRLAGRPYEALRDAPAAGDEPMWAAHRARMAERLKQARARRPLAAWARLDPYGVRISLVLLIACAAFLAGERAGDRLGDAFAPRLMAGGGAGAEAEFWIEPPAYTGRPVQYLRSAREADILEGSVLAARITGLRRDPRVDGAPAEIEPLSEDVRQVTARPEASGEIVIRAGALRESLTLTLIPDEAPRVRLAAEPEGDAQGRLELEFTVEDDFGVEDFALHLAAAPEDTDAAPGEVEIIALAPGDVGPADGEGVRTATIDIARHPLAGQRAVIRLAATDGAGQTGVSGPLELTLPSRVFLDPLARAVASERRGFIAVEGDYLAMPEGPVENSGFLTDEPERRIERAPGEIQRLARALDAVSDAPARYFDDPIVWMGLRTAMREVRRARELDQLSHLDEDLWQIALRAELGSLADAEAALRAAEQALMDALARGADPIELSALFDAFEQAMANYLQALAREAAEEGRFAEAGGGGGGMNGDRLQALLDALRDAAELGDTEGSRRALAQLAEMLRNMQVTLSQGGQGGEGQESAMSRALREALEELGETLGDQRDVTGDTFEEAQRGNEQGGQRSGEGSSGQSAAGQGEPLPAPGERPGEGFGAPQEGGQGAGAGSQEGQTGGRAFEEGSEGTSALAQRQGEIAGALPGLAGRIPEAGEDAEAAREALGAARDAMEAARRALEAGDADGALAAQERAIDALREAARAASEAYEAAEGGEPGQDGPLGRGGQQGTGSETGVPSEAERQRAREILEELRRRAAERGRPQEELDYIDRLLERF